MLFQPVLGGECGVACVKHGAVEQASGVGHANHASHLDLGAVALLVHYHVEAVGSGSGGDVVVGDVGVEEIRREVEKYESPVVFIDYAQIIAPISDRKTDKQNVDANITALKRLSRDYGLPVVAISSFNRESYRESVSMASFKESGAIEYSSDVLIGLQYNGWDYDKNDIKVTDRLARLRRISAAMSKAAEEGNSQSIQAKILKNRNGSRHDVYFDFFPMFNFFRAVNYHE